MLPNVPQKDQRVRVGDVLTHIPEKVLLSLVQFWKDGDLCEWSIQRYDREWKVKIGGYQKGKF